MRFVKDDRINWLVSNKVPDYTIIYNQLKSQKFCTAIKKKSNVDIDNIQCYLYKPEPKSLINIVAILSSLSFLAICV